MRPLGLSEAGPCCQGGDIDYHPRTPSSYQGIPEMTIFLWLSVVNNWTREATKPSFALARVCRHAFCLVLWKHHLLSLPSDLRIASSSHQNHKRQVACGHTISAWPRVTRWLCDVSDEILWKKKKMVGLSNRWHSLEDKPSPIFHSQALILAESTHRWQK